MLEPNGSGESVAQVAARWIRVYVATARSAKNVGMAAQRVRDYLAPFMGELPIQAVSPDAVRRYRLHLQDRGLAARTVRHLLTDFRCMLGWAAESGLLVRSPFPRRIMPRIQESVPDRLSEDEIRAVLAIPEPWAFVIRLGLATGLRWGELCRARREHLVQGDARRGADEVDADPTRPARHRPRPRDPNPPRPAGALLGGGEQLVREAGPTPLRRGTVPRAPAPAHFRLQMDRGRR